MAKLQPELKQKVQSITDYSGKPITSEEMSVLYELIKDEDAELEERILAAKICTNIAQNRIKRATNSYNYFNGLFLKLVHVNETEKAKNSLIKQGTEKLADIPGIEEVLKLLLERAKR